jgi:hypothetical protein
VSCESPAARGRRLGVGLVLPGAPTASVENRLGLLLAAEQLCELFKSVADTTLSSFKLLSLSGSRQAFKDNIARALPAKLLLQPGPKGKRACAY